MSIVWTKNYYHFPVLLHEPNLKFRGSPFYRYILSLDAIESPIKIYTDSTY